MAELYRGLFPILDDDNPADRNILYAEGMKFGAIPRDYDEQPETMFSPPAEIELIQQSEWDARYDEQEEHQSSLEHMYLSGSGGAPAFVNLDQNGDGDCHTADTEVLTERGFVPWSDYNWTDLLGTVNPQTHALEYQAPFEKHIYDYDGPMVHSTNKRVDFAVTPKHQMYVRKWDESARRLSKDYSFVRAGELGWYTGLLSTPSGSIGTELVELEVPGDRRYDGDDFLAILGLVSSNGYAGGTENTKSWVSFSYFLEEQRDAVAALASRTGFHQAPGRPGVWIRYDAGAFAEWLRANMYVSGVLGARNKRVPELVKSASMRQIKLFLHYFQDRIRDSRQFFTSSKRLADDLQELHLMIGRRTSLGVNEPREHTMASGKVARDGGNSYTLTVSETDRLCLDRKKHLETDRYRGPVYCAGVPNHTLITRRNGTLLVSSNCWAYSTGHAIMLDRLKKGLSHVRLNPHATAAILKRPDTGGWCGLSAQSARDIGYAPEGSGPGQWPLHSHNMKHYTPEMKAIMAQFRVVEDWYDLTRQAYNQKMTTLQLATMGFNNIPAPSDFNWWGHSVCQIRWVRIEPGSWGPLIINSWKGWGRHGLAVLRGSKAIANGAVAIRSTTASSGGAVKAEPATAV